MSARATGFPRHVFRVVLLYREDSRQTSIILEFALPYELCQFGSLTDSAIYIIQPEDQVRRIKGGLTQNEAPVMVRPAIPEQLAGRQTERSPACRSRHTPCVIQVSTFTMYKGTRRIFVPDVDAIFSPHPLGASSKSLVRPTSHRACRD
jgi:hypothetical protein